MMMRRFSISLAFVALAAMVLAAQASAIDISKLLNNEQGPDKFQVIHVQDLSKLMADGSGKVFIYDANHPSLREKAGIIPGAHLLSSYNDYDLSELTPDKNAQLVFYCADLH